MYPLVDELLCSGLHRTARRRGDLPSYVGRNVLVVALVGESPRDDCNWMVSTHRKRMVESSAVARNERDIARNQSDVNRNGGLSSDVAHSTIQRVTVARKKFAKHFQPGRKLDFTPTTLLEKLDSDKGNENEIGEDE